MRTEPATILVIQLGAVFFFFLLLPLAVVLVQLPAVRRADPKTWALLVGIVLLTGFFFILFFAGVFALLGVWG